MPEDAFTYENRTVVVTGGTGALGTAVVEALLDRHATVHIPWAAEHELKHFPHGSRVTLQQVDLRDEKSVTAFYAGLKSLWASVHMVGGFAMAPVAETSADDFRKMFELNALTCFLCCREATKAIRRTTGTAGGTASGGRIVNVAARPAVAPVGGMIAYSTSKAAVASITQSLAEELRPEGILVNAVLPSIMDTPGNRAAMPTADFSRWPKVEEVAQAITFLAGPANALTTGALMPVYGRS